ncbi:hypothetical protein X777_02578, partial [Ooceraea biroi]
LLDDLQIRHVVLRSSIEEVVYPLDLCRVLGDDQLTDFLVRSVINAGVHYAAIVHRLMHRQGVLLLHDGHLHVRVSHHYFASSGASDDATADDHQVERAALILAENKISFV